jgi:hypothetical protein
VEGGEGGRRSARPKGANGPTGLIKRRKNRKVLIFEFKDISEFGKTLRISTRRFRRYLDTRIFPKFF